MCNFGAGVGAIVVFWFFLLTLLSTLLAKEHEEDINVTVKGVIMWGLMGLLQVKLFLPRVWQLNCLKD
jgi:arginine exporter protein ArgO